MHIANGNHQFEGKESKIQLTITPFLHVQRNGILKGGNNALDGVPLDHHVVQKLPNSMGFFFYEL